MCGLSAVTSIRELSRWSPFLQHRMCRRAPLAAARAGPLPFAVVVEITSKVTTAARTARESVPGRTATPHEREQGARADNRSRLTTCRQTRHDPERAGRRVVGIPPRKARADRENLAPLAQRDPCGTGVADPGRHLPRERRPDARASAREGTA